MAIQSKCTRCGRFVAGKEGCCGAIKQVSIKRRKDVEEEDEFEAKPDSKSLAEALFGPKGELVEEDVEEEKEQEEE